MNLVEDYKLAIYEEKKLMPHFRSQISQKLL